ncbi:citrate synthase-lysine N-methyltransferase CSKMT, mitochondrial-like isoform X1 [Saccostrea cucullata]|uniref:citrate synthase-lysine N-methyltransferase CSKMT, mitochondrial-like isoform X1 n=2 Tax=Saccostrea cuccullata TaxID=36930 RepID=UPI002ED16AC9
MQPSFQFSKLREGFMSLLKRTIHDDSKLSKREYWRNRYNWEKQVKMDWLVDADKVSENLEPKIHHLYKRLDKVCLNILDLGCGTSDVASVLLKKCRSPMDIYCVDYSEGALQWQKGLLSALNQKHGNIMSNYWLVMADICHLPFKDNFFHVILDKGTIDSLLKSEDGQKLAESSMTEILRVMHPAGNLWQITDEDPDVRLLFLQTVQNDIKKKYSSSFEILLSDNINEYFLYTVKEDTHEKS